MRTIALIFILSLSYFLSNGQNSKVLGETEVEEEEEKKAEIKINYTQLKIEKINNEVKYGVIDKKTKKILIPVKYDSISIFRNSGSSMLNSDKYSLKEQLYKVKLGDYYGVLNSKNEIVIPIKYSIINNNSIGQKNKMGVVNLDGDILIPFLYDEFNFKFLEYNKILAKKNDNWGIIDSVGKVLLPFEYKEINQLDLIKSKTKLRCFKLKNKKDKYGIITFEGINTIIDFEFDDLKIIGNSTFINEKEYNNSILIGNKNNYLGIIDSYGNELMPFEFQDINPIIFNQYDPYESVINLICKKNDKFGLVFCFKQTILDYKYDKITYINSRRLAVKLDGKYGLFTIGGKELLKPSYDYISYFPSRFADKSIKLFARAERNSKYGKINMNGEVVESINSPFEKGYENRNTLLAEFINILKSKDTLSIIKFIKKTSVSNMDMEFALNQTLRLQYNGQYRKDPAFLKDVENGVIKQILQLREKLKEKNLLNFIKKENLLILNNPENIQLANHTIPRNNITLNFNYQNKKYVIYLGGSIKLEQYWKLYYDLRLIEK